jgi:hypothetical protein
VETVSLRNGHIGQNSYSHADGVDLLSLVVAVVVSKLHGKTGAGLSPRSAPTSRRLRCTFIFHLCILLDTLAHATMVLLGLAALRKQTCTW